MGDVFSAARPIEVEAKIDGPTGEPLDKSAKPRIRLKMPPGVSDKEVKQPIPMSPRPGAAGWFTGKFRVRSPGVYELTLEVPDPADKTGESVSDSETKKFTVKEANPELDDTRPDFDRMYRLASEADDVLLRMTDADRQELVKSLQRPKMEAPRDGADKTVELREDKPRLYFNLQNAKLIPKCMISDVQKQTSKGPVNDVWDDGFVVKRYDDPKPGQPPKPPIKISYALLLAVGLLSAEWLIRKLLRLA
jgi:hypothetical protein